ncbi:MAG: hypothetical protein D6730_21015, partial [Bacteroidetes bacterium]
WLGGEGDGWERGPYWIDGLLPLAYLLDDQQLKDKVQPWIAWSLSHQAESGYFGPIPFETTPEPEPGLQKTPRRDWWPKMVMLKVLQQYYTATGDERVITLMSNYFRYQLNELPHTPIDHWSLWGNRRAGDNMMVVYWLYNITGEAFLLELAELIQQQAFPWERLFLNQDCYEEKHDPWHYSRVVKRYPYDQAQLDNLCIKQYGSFHTVNLAQGIKKPLIYFQQHPDSLYLRAVKQAFRDIRKYHGQPQGMYGGDEPLHGPAPTQGVELCSVVEMMFSLEKMMAITPEIQFMDHLEKLAFNALPAQIDADFQTRQYMQCANQVEISRRARNFYQDVGHQGTDICYGVLTGYPCCTCNMHQGWPKFTQSLWHATTGNGLAALVYAPSRVKARVGAGEGVEVEIHEQTTYPFSDTITFVLTTPRTVDFPFHLRLPAWCTQAEIRLNGQAWAQQAGNQIVVIDRSWQDQDRLQLILPSAITYSRWMDYSVAIEKGPLLYALKVEAEKKWVENPDHYGNYYELSATSDWNYALIENYLQQPARHFQLQRQAMNDYPWTLEAAPLRITTRAVKLPHWKLYNGMPGPLPWSPPRLQLQGWQLQTVELVPYGCTSLRISEFPTVWFDELEQ